MQLPDELKLAIEQLCSSLGTSELQKAREIVSSQYRAGKSSVELFRNPAQLCSYLVTRVPATFAACRAVFNQLSISPRSILDLGAGPGTASWAARDVFPEIDQFFLIERERAAIEIGQQMAKNTSLEKASWTQADLRNELKLPFVDLGVLSYVVAESGVNAVPWSQLFSACAILVVIEPGTPAGYQRILQVRDLLIQLGGHVLAPCPHSHKCPMVGDDWCHFGARVERTRLHRLLKEGSLGFEDEKYSYVVMGKEPQLMKDRVIDPPEMGHGNVKLRLCTQSGKLEQKVLTKKHREEYRRAKKLSWGDSYSDTLAE